MTAKERAKRAETLLVRVGAIFSLLTLLDEEKIRQGRLSRRARPTSFVPQRWDGCLQKRFHLKTF